MNNNKRVYNSYSQYSQNNQPDPIQYQSISQSNVKKQQEFQDYIVIFF
jgi:hypothetical protein